MKQKAFLIGITIIILLIGNSAWSQQGGVQAVNNQKTNQKMENSTAEKNKAIMRSIIEDVLNKRKTELLKDLIDDEYTGPRGGKGHEGFMAAVQPLFAAFPDIAWTIEDIVGDGNTVMIHVIWKGTHKGQFAKYPATGKPITNDGTAMYKFRNGKVISSITFPDRLSFFQQIGVVPSDL